MFGLNVHTILFDSALRRQAISGTNSLVTLANGPEGLLFKKITNMQEAISCGGVILYDLAGTKWVFYLGSTLRDVLSANLLGKVHMFGTNGAPNSFATWENVPAWKSGVIFYQNAALTMGINRTTPNGKLYAGSFLKDVFPAGADVGVLGVVCSATDGMGVSAGNSYLVSSIPGFTAQRPGLGYISTEIPLVLTFEQYMTKTLDAAYASIPADVLSYYERTYAATMSSINYKNSKPTTAVCSYWKDSALWTGETRVSRIVAVSGSRGMAPYTATSAALGAVEGVQTDESFGGGYSGSYSSTGVVSGKYMLHAIPGSYNRTVSKLPILDYATGWSDSSKILTPPTGEFGGLKAGTLRDAQLLKRSLVDQIKYSDVGCPFQNLAEFVNDTVVDFSYVDNTPIGDMTDAQLALMRTQNVANVASEAASIFSRGSLPSMLEAFSRSWDMNAQALAEAEN